jgi:D-glycero-alpha-D-manno-heptose-7-phosphate kinase
VPKSASPRDRDSERRVVTVAKRAPTRIDFGGGWTDVPPYSEQEGGFVCNLAIARYATARCTTTRDGAPLEIHTERATDRSLVEAAARRAAGGSLGIAIALQNDFPVGAGLGGSSAAGVALAAALAERGEEHLAREVLAERSRETEIEDLGIAGGRQDHYAAAFGGALALRFSDRVEVEHLPISPTFRDAVHRRVQLIYTGQSRISGDTITAVLDAYRAGDRRVLYALERLKQLAQQMRDAVRAGDLDGLAALVGEHWFHQRALHPAIPTARIDEIVEHARLAGARGAKALGASGGGCVLVVAAEGHEKAVRDAISPLGELLEFAIDEQGVASCP